MEHKTDSLTYAGAGVDIEAGNRAVGLMKQAVKSTFRPGVMADIGGFGGLFALDTAKYKEPVLVSGTDGVGTKLRVAQLTNVHNTIGIDAVAMCVNDILVQGAEPLFFLDYLAVGKLVPERVADIVSGVAEGCRQSGCALIGGETAEMPGFYAEEEYDIAGFAVGVVDRGRIIDGSKIAAGDLVIGLPSSGLHSNGYSLARKALLEVAGYQVDSFVPEFGHTVGEELITPTRIYVKSILPLLNKFDIKGLAHITGGGLTENIPRVLPEGVKVVLDRSKWTVPPVFKVIQGIGQVAEEEMLRTFNMGIGLVIIVHQEQAELILKELAESGERACLIGRVEQGENLVEYLGA
ncbi:phosphoribosylformylglycinamidine cyclo-ligase [Desulforamulus aquiferis]|uniref:Phosphoribosylformylglycinamidine cyclo-ligase n=1 Tax=Desulforamulus aquiferis TaxID=1397668 RepID=A0AAW7ZGF4_9FIRM|nr:phosphoribosylformylglycinamidine cyclo-ligase [Desulforamulus aquiferis]MDO7788411.1 phosphoribosylformylglycinamidine cyclo-ligase [Desulforamulus aquiferis]